MIKNCCYIKSFTPQQKALLQEIAAEKGFKTATDVFFFALEQYKEQKVELARKDWVIAYKQKKIDRLTGETPQTNLHANRRQRD